MFSDDFVSLKCLYSFPLIRRLLDHSLVYHKDVSSNLGPPIVYYDLYEVNIELYMMFVIELY